MTEQKMVCGASKAIFTQCHWNFSSFTSSTMVAPCESIIMRCMAAARSSSVKNLACDGVCGMVKKQITPNTTVIAPSTETRRGVSSLKTTDPEQRLTEEDPRPSIISIVSYLSQARGQEATKRTRKRGRAIKQTNAIHHLVTTIEHGQVNDDTTEQATFEQTE